MTLTLSNRFFSFDRQRGSTIVTTSKRDYHLTYLDDIDLKHCKVGLFGIERGTSTPGGNGGSVLVSAWSLS